MNAKKFFIPALFFMASMILPNQILISQISEAEKLYEEGIYQLEAAGNFDEAIEIFNQVVTKYASDKVVAANALLKLGLCYERQGSQKAEEVYTRIIEKFPDQPEQVAAARERLNALRQQSDMAGQTIKLSYDDKSVVSNSLSPDGTRMALTDFSEGQNVAFFDFTTKTMELITHYNWTDYWTFFPIWSPDMKEIAYIKSEWKNTAPFNLCVSTLDGKERVLYSNPQKGSRIYPSEWMPDGSGIVVVLQDSSGFSLAIIETTGGGKFDILKKFEEDNISLASVSPDCRFIAYSDGKQSGNKDINIIELETRNITTLIDNPANDGAPRWSPDGNYIVFRSDRHGEMAIWGIEVKDGVPVGPPFMILAGGKDLRLLNWTTAGLAMGRAIQISDIYILPVDPASSQSTGQPRLLQYTPTGANYFATWSPDGKEIVFVKQNREKIKSSLVIVSSEDLSSREYQLPPKWGSGIPRWTPNGKMIGFSGYDSTQITNLYRLNIENGEWNSWPLELESWTSMEWGKDGKTFYYSDNFPKPDENGSSYGRIYKGIAGSKERQVLYDAGNDMRTAIRALRCSRDYNYLAFQQDNYIMILDLQTGNSNLLTPLADTSSKPFPPVAYGHPSWSPDGSKIMTTKMSSGEKGGQSFEVFVFDKKTGLGEKLNMGSILPKDAQIREIDWSPIGDEVLISTFFWMMEDQLMKTVIPKDQH